MKYCMVIQETLRRELLIEADSYEDARNFLEKKYLNEEIVLTADDSIGECMKDCIFEADWYSPEDFEGEEPDYDIRNSGIETERKGCEENEHAEKQ